MEDRASFDVVPPSDEVRMRVEQAFHSVDVPRMKRGHHLVERSRRHHLLQVVRKQALCRIVVVVDHAPARGRPAQHHKDVPQSPASAVEASDANRREAALRERRPFAPAKPFRD